MLPLKLRAQVEAYLDRLSEDDRVRLAERVDRQSDVRKRDPKLAALRIVLRERGYYAHKIVRKLTPMRLFFEQGAAFFVNEKLSKKAQGCIQRKSLSVLWAWMLRDVFSQEHRQHISDLHERAMNEGVRLSELYQLNTKLQGCFCQAISDVFAKIDGNEKNYQRYASQLGGVDVLDDALDYWQILLRADQITPVVKMVFRKEIDHLDPIFAQLKRVFLDHSLSQDTRLAHYLMLAVVSHLKNPFDIFALVGVPEGQAVELRDGTDCWSDIAGAVLEIEIERLQKAYSASLEYQFSEDVIERTLKRMVFFVRHVEFYIRLEKSPAFSDKIRFLQKHMCILHERAFSDLPQQISRYVRPMGTGQARFLDDERDIQKTRMLLFVMMQLKGQADLFSLNKTVSDTHSQIMKFVERHIDLIFEQLYASGDGVSEAALEHATRAIDMAAYLFSPEYNDLLRRRLDNIRKLLPQEETSDSTVDLDAILSTV